EIFEAILKIEEQEAEDRETEEKNDKNLLTDKEKIQRLKQILSPEITEALSDTVFERLIELSAKERETGKDLLIHPLRDILNNGVRTENIKSSTEQLKQIINYTN